MSTFGREQDALWYRKRYRETGDKKYLQLAEETEAWLDPLEKVIITFVHRVFQGDDR
jgi:hypothetical protein